jgi:hypothetical protein
MATNPMYKKDDVVYLKESAMIGFVESYKINGIRLDSRLNKWVYEINISHRGPETSTMIDMVNLRSNEKLSFYEDELTDFCDAVQLAYTHAQERVAFLQAQLSARCGSTEGNT